MLSKRFYNSILLKISKLIDYALAQKLQNMAVEGIKNASHQT